MSFATREESADAAEQAIEQTLERLPEILGKIEVRCGKKQWLQRDVEQYVTELVEPLKRYIREAEAELFDEDAEEE